MLISSTTAYSHWSNKVHVSEMLTYRTLFLHILVAWWWKFYESYTAPIGYKRTNKQQKNFLFISRLVAKILAYIIISLKRWTKGLVPNTLQWSSNFKIKNKLGWDWNSQHTLSIYNAEKIDNFCHVHLWLI